MKTYLISLLVTVVLISVVQMILPRGKTAAVATGVLSVAMVLCFLKPAGSLSFDFSGRGEADSAYEKNVSSFNLLTDKYLKKYYESAFSDVLKRNDLICDKVIVEICDKKIIRAEIYLSNMVIDENYEHININVITDYVAETLGVEREILTVYG